VLASLRDQKALGQLLEHRVVELRLARPARPVLVSLAGPARLGDLDGRSTNRPVVSREGTDRADRRAVEPAPSRGRAPRVSAGPADGAHNGSDSAGGASAARHSSALAPHAAPDVAVAGAPFQTSHRAVRALEFRTGPNAGRRILDHPRSCGRTGACGYAPLGSRPRGPAARRSSSRRLLGAASPARAARSARRRRRSVPPRRWR
jgi:hypothetical protein